MAPMKKNLRSVSDNGRYPEFCQRAARDPEVFAHFKRNEDYREILEHVSEDLGRQYLEIIKNKWPDLIACVGLLKRNDAFGDPIRFEYPDIGRMSPSTLRYIKVACDLNELFGPLDGFNVIEIGGGYVGQMLIADEIWPLKSWTIFDLPEALELVERCNGKDDLSWITAPYKLFSPDQLYREWPGTDLVISNYAFSELPRVEQLHYLVIVLRNAKRGYMTMNNASPDGMSAEELMPYFDDARIIEEVPLTSKGNYIFVWGAN
jgi:hypothetical protein